MAAMNKTLRVKLPFGATLGLALLMIGLLFLAMEGLARIKPVHDLLPVPSVGSQEPFFDYWVDQANQTESRWGHIDCIVVGSSVVNQGLNLQAFQNAYRAATGEAIHCVKFHLPGLPTLFIGEFSKVLIQLYHPRLLIYANNARDYQVAFQPGQMGSMTEVQDTPWYQYLQGKFSLQGWLVDHSISYRYFLAGRNWMRLAPAAAPSKAVDVSRPPQPGMEQDRIEAFAHYKVSQDALTGIAALAKLNSDQTQVLMVEIPLHPSFKYYLPHGEQDLDQAYQIVQDKAHSVGIPFWRVENLPPLPDKDWIDRIHLNAKGAAVYGQWLGNRVAQGVQAGEIQDPTQATQVPR